jgi:hypothetical protein
MGAMLGFIMGYYLGVKAGPNGYEELQDAWKTISSSAEVKDTISGGVSVARDLLRQGGAMVASRLADPETPLRRVA